MLSFLVYVVAYVKLCYRIGKYLPLFDNLRAEIESRPNITVTVKQ